MRDLTLRYFALYLVLVALSGVLALGALSLWEQASRESLRVTAMLQDVEGMRGDLYRQMKELFDSTFLDDPNSQAQYQFYSGRIDDGLRRLADRASGESEQAAVRELKRTYHSIHARTDAIVSGPVPPEGRVLQRIFDTDLEAGGLQAYEAAFDQVDRLFLLQQTSLQQRLHHLSAVTPLLLLVPLLAAFALLWLTWRFLDRAVVQPFSSLQAAARVLAGGDLAARIAPGGLRARELAELGEALNQMAGELQQSRAALLRAERQATLGALVPVVAHNIRNPMASIRATAQVIDDEALAPEIREGLRGIMRSTDRLERWTASLLSYLHPLQARLQPGDVVATLTGLLDLVEVQFRRRDVTLQRHLAADVPPVPFDTDLLEQAVHGLLMNALEATPAGEAVEVHLQLRERRIEVRILDRGPGLQWTVSATGSQRDPVVPGRTTKRTGTGLGIPFALKVSEVHDGGLRYEVRPGGGTEALFWIPCP